MDELPQIKPWKIYADGVHTILTTKYNRLFWKLREIFDIHNLGYDIQTGYYEEHYSRYSYLHGLYDEDNKLNLDYIQEHPSIYPNNFFHDLRKKLKLCNFDQVIRDLVITGWQYVGFINIDDFRTILACVFEPYLPYFDGIIPECLYRLYNKEFDLANYIANALYSVHGEANIEENIRARISTDPLFHYFRSINNDDKEELAIDLYNRLYGSLENDLDIEIEDYDLNDPELVDMLFHRIFTIASKHVENYFPQEELMFLESLMRRFVEVYLFEKNMQDTLIWKAIFPDNQQPIVFFFVF